MGQAMHDLGIERMPLEQRIALVQEIWDTVAVDAGLPSSIPAEFGLLEQRVAEDDASPDDVVPWESIKAEAAKRWRR
jgi:putative addiction module component (TIGR02574 family)